MPFPDRVLFQPSDSPVVFLHDWDTVLARLTYFARGEPDFTILEIEDGSYVQCAGTTKRLTAETRRYDKAREFTHFVWGKGRITGKTEQVSCTDGTVTVDSSQILTMRDARVLIMAFLEGTHMLDKYIPENITHRFGPVPEDMLIRNNAWNWPDRRKLRRRRAERVAAHGG